VPENSAYMVAAYLVVGALYGGYSLWLYVKGKKP
jgi:hypothetical protein